MRVGIERFLESLQADKKYSPNTIVAYRNDLGQFASYFETLVSGWEQISKEQLVQYVNSLKGDREYASATVARKVAAIKSLFHFLASQGQIAQDPSADLGTPHVRKSLPATISEQDVEKLLNAPDVDDAICGLRDRALLQVLYATGMRVSEVVALNLQDIDWGNGSISCFHESGKVRKIPLQQEPLAELNQYIANSRSQLVHNNLGETALFVNHRGQRLTRQGLWLIIKKHVAKVGIAQTVTPHTLRHSFAAHRLSKGADVHQVQELLGHANVSTTQVYTQVAPK
ncbi:MAG: tyrosine recombinase [Chloroflexi bacterium]|nr:tyrosine recombinase [Chloroflexota bacterium]